MNISGSEILGKNCVDKDAVGRELGERGWVHGRGAVATESQQASVLKCHFSSDLKKGGRAGSHLDAPIPQSLAGQ